METQKASCSQRKDQTVDGQRKMCQLFFLVFGLSKKLLNSSLSTQLRDYSYCRTGVKLWGDRIVGLKALRISWRR